jgi:hypothetical protein
MKVLDVRGMSGCACASRTEITEEHFSPYGRSGSENKCDKEEEK